MPHNSRKPYSCSSALQSHGANNVRPSSTGNEQYALKTGPTAEAVNTYGDLPKQIQRVSECIVGSYPDEIRTDGELEKY